MIQQGTLVRFGIVAMMLAARPALAQRDSVPLDQLVKAGDIVRATLKSRTGQKEGVVQRATADTVIIGIDAMSRPSAALTRANLVQLDVGLETQRHVASGMLAGLLTGGAVGAFAGWHGAGKCTEPANCEFEKMGQGLGAVGGGLLGGVLGTLIGGSLGARTHINWRHVFP